MKFELAPRSKLRLNPQNPKLITEASVEKMCVYLQTHGFKDPVEARREDGLVVAGHRRLLASDRLGLDLIPTIWHEGMSDEEATAYTIAHSRSEKDVAFNRALLADQVSGMAEDLIPGLGFDETELVELFDLDRGAADPDGAGDDEGGGRACLLPGEVWTIGPVSFRVFKGLSNTSLLAAEGYIRKISKLLKKPAHLEGDEGALFEAVMKERAHAHAEVVEHAGDEPVVAGERDDGVRPVHGGGSVDQPLDGHQPSVGRRRRRARVEPEPVPDPAGGLPAVEQRAGKRRAAGRGHRAGKR